MNSHRPLKTAIGPGREEYCLETAGIENPSLQTMYGVAGNDRHEWENKFDFFKQPKQKQRMCKHA